MGKVENWDEMSLPGMLKGYNAKPVLLTASGSLHHDKKRDYAEECGNVFMWNYIARRVRRKPPFFFFSIKPQLLSRALVL